MRDTAKLLMVGLLTVVGVCVLALTTGVYGGRFELVPSMIRGIFLFSLLAGVLVVGALLQQVEARCRFVVSECSREE